MHNFASEAVHHRVEDYLDQTCAPMVDQIDYPERAAIREELRGHLWALIEASMELGMSETEAVRSAIRQMGKPKRLARAFGVRRRIPANLLVLGASFCVLAGALIVGMPRKVEKAPEPPKTVVQTVALVSNPGSQHQEWVSKKIPCLSCHADNANLRMAVASQLLPSSEVAPRP